MNKIVLVTGASSGIGKEIFETLRNKGITAIGLARSFSNSVNDGVFHLDVSNKEEVKEVFSKIVETYGRIDALINVAGFGISGAVEDTPNEAIERQMAVNFLGTVYTVKEALPYMRKQGGGIIVNFSSIAGIFGLPFQAFYSSSKFAVEGFSQALRLEVEPFNIKVVVIEPGDFKTGFTSKREKFTNTNSPYYKRFLNAISKMEHDEQNGANPKVVGEVVYKILTSNRVKEKYIVGPFFEKLFVTLKRVFGDSLTTLLFKIYYGL